VSRPRKFNEKDVLTKAMQVFWKKGYIETSIPDLEGATGLKRGSLYNAYKDKRGIYLAILKHYAKVEIGEAISILTKTEDLSSGYKALLHRVVLSSGSSYPYLGCLLCDAVGERVSHDREVMDLIKILFEPMWQVIISYLSQLSPSVPQIKLQASVDTLFTSYLGFRMMCKLGYDKDRLLSIVASECNKLDQLIDMYKINN
jgi:TetR/AcrR family transcriptional repressor of nem operon